MAGRPRWLTRPGTSPEQWGRHLRQRGCARRRGSRVWRSSTSSTGRPASRRTLSRRSRSSGSAASTRTRVVVQRGWLRPRATTTTNPITAGRRQTSKSEPIQKSPRQRAQVAPSASDTTPTMGQRSGFMASTLRRSLVEEQGSTPASTPGKTRPDPQAPPPRPGNRWSPVSTTVWSLASDKERERQRRLLDGLGGGGVAGGVRGGARAAGAVRRTG